MHETLNLLEKVWKDMQPFFIHSSPKLFRESTAWHVFRSLRRKHPELEKLKSLESILKGWSHEKFRSFVEDRIRKGREEIRQAAKDQMQRRSAAQSVDFRVLDTILSREASSFFEGKKGADEKR